MLITTTTGKEVRTIATKPLRTAAVQAVAFSVQSNGLEEPLFITYKTRQRILGGTRHAEHGSWIMAEYNLPERTIIKFFVVKQETGYIKRCFGAYLVLESSASPQVLRSAGLDKGGGSNTFVSVEGPFRILLPEDFADCGIKVAPNLIRCYERPEEYFEVLRSATTETQLIGARALDL